MLTHLGSSPSGGSDSASSFQAILRGAFAGGPREGEQSFFSRSFDDAGGPLGSAGLARRGACN